MGDHFRSVSFRLLPDSGGRLFPVASSLLRQSDGLLDLSVISYQYQNYREKGGNYSSGFFCAWSASWREVVARLMSRWHIKESISLDGEKQSGTRVLLDVLNSAD